MISKEILKKHNLKAVPFSCIGEGESFWDWTAVRCHAKELTFWERRLLGESIVFADGGSTCYRAAHYRNETVYVPVWRVTN